jgi:conjugal transfer pilus assembly protein TraF
MKWQIIEQIRKAIKLSLVLYLSSLFITMICPSDSQAFVFDEKACLEYGLGKNWRCESKENLSDEDKQNNITANDILESKISPEEKATRLNELWEVQRKRAVITEDKKEIERFLETHNIIVDKGVNFSKHVQKIIDNNPKLANSQSYYKNRVEEEIKDEEKDEILNRAKLRYGLAFIYSSSCTHCGKQFPIILEFKKKYKLNVLGITMDEHYFEGLDENIVDPNIANDPMIVALPTMILVDKQNPTKLFIAKGITSFSDLEDKIVNKIKEQEENEEGR